MALTVPLDRISSEAHRLDVRKGVLALVRLMATIVVGIPYVLGWSLRKLWLGLTMLWVAAAEGWREAGRSRAPKGGRVR